MEENVLYLVPDNFTLVENRTIGRRKGERIGRSWVRFSLPIVYFNWVFEFNLTPFTWHKLCHIPATCHPYVRITDYPTSGAVRMLFCFLIPMKVLDLTGKIKS